MQQTQEVTGNREGRSSNRLNRFWSVVLWGTVVVLAVFPFPWWW